MLKRARLADSLNDQLSHRPGPLELIQKNILHTDENVERAVKGTRKEGEKMIPIYYCYYCHREQKLKFGIVPFGSFCNFIFIFPTEGQIPFRATCEGSAIRPTHPFRYVTPEGDDSSSEGN